MVLKSCSGSAGFAEGVRETRRWLGFRWRGDRGRHGRGNPVVHAVAVLPAVSGTASRFLTPWDLLGLAV